MGEAFVEGIVEGVENMAPSLMSAIETTMGAAIGAAVLQAHEATAAFDAWMESMERHIATAPDVAQAMSEVAAQLLGMGKTAEETERLVTQLFQRVQAETAAASDAAIRANAANAEWWDNAQRILSQRATAEFLYNQQLVATQAASEAAAAAEVRHWELVSNAIGSAVTSMAEFNAISINDRIAGDDAARDTAEADRAADAASALRRAVAAAQALFPGGATINASLVAALEPIMAQFRVGLGPLLTALQNNGWIWDPAFLEQFAGTDDSQGPADSNASGVRNWRGGLSWVGERGPELVSLPRGSDVYSNQESQAMAAGSGRVERLLMAILAALRDGLTLDGQRVSQSVLSRAAASGSLASQFGVGI